MHNAEFKIIQILAKSSKELSTTDLVQELFKEEYREILKNLKNSEKTIIQDAKRKKAQLHRKILYHLNKLTKENYIYVAQILGKGEKLCKINNEKRLENRKRRIVT